MAAAIIREEGGAWVSLRTTGPAPAAGPDGAVDRDLEDADPEWAQYVAWADREAAAAQVPEPEPWVIDDVESWDLEAWDQEPWDPERRGTRTSPSLVPPEPVPAGLCSRRAGSTFCGPGRPLFAQDGAADVMVPSPFLAALTEHAGAPENELVRARSATCDAPGCRNSAATADLDHTVPWPDGPTSQANLAPRCRTHHRAKQAPDWTVEQLAPGVTRWTLPSGRAHITTPTRYDL